MFIKYIIYVLKVNFDSRLIYIFLCCSKDFCPQYNTGAKDINTVPCKISIGCPDVPFRSNEVYKCKLAFLLIGSLKIF